MSPTSKQPRVSKHAIERTAERLGFRLTHDEWQTLLDAMHHENAPGIALKQSTDAKGMVFFLAMIRGHPVTLVWSPKTLELVTVMFAQLKDPRSLRYENGRVRPASMTPEALPKSERRKYGGQRAKTRWDPEIREKKMRGKWRGADDE
jgi:hypothetical protein